MCRTLAPHYYLKSESVRTFALQASKAQMNSLHSHVYGF
jgi:hypothetical protein